MITAIITAIFLLFTGTVTANDVFHPYISLTVENEVHSEDGTAVFKLEYPQEINGMARLYLKTNSENDDMAARAMVENGNCEFQIAAIEGTYYVVCVDDETGETFQSNEAIVNFTADTSVSEEVTTTTESTIASAEEAIVTTTEITTMPPEYSTVADYVTPWLACGIVILFLIITVIKKNKQNK